MESCHLPGEFVFMYTQNRLSVTENQQYSTQVLVDILLIEVLGSVYPQPLVLPSDSVCLWELRLSPVLRLQLNT